MMKRSIILTLTLIASLLSLFSATDERILIAYFTLSRNAENGDIDALSSASLSVSDNSLVGTTEYIAMMIESLVGGDLYSIETIDLYPSNFSEVVNQNHNEAREGYLPPLSSPPLDISQYDSIFLGFPIWASNVPQAVLSFLSLYDFSGKKIVPFCTHDGYGAGRSRTSIEQACDGDILPVLSILGDDVYDALDTVIRYLESTDFTVDMENIRYASIMQMPLLS